jgi:hypothetical protein
MPELLDLLDKVQHDLLIVYGSHQFPGVLFHAWLNNSCRPVGNGGTLGLSNPVVPTMERNMKSSRHLVQKSWQVLTIHGQCNLHFPLPDICGVQHCPLQDTIL